MIKESNISGRLDGEIKKYISVAGINSAMMAGEVAGNAIIRALENDDLSLLEQYETRVRRLLARSLEKRHKLDACCTQNELLQQHLPELWVIFRQYWDQFYNTG